MVDLDREIILTAKFSLSTVDGFHGVWLHFRRARVGVCVWCSCVWNTDKEVLYCRIVAFDASIGSLIPRLSGKFWNEPTHRVCLQGCVVSVCRVIAMIFIACLTLSLPLILLWKWLIEFPFWLVIFRLPRQPPAETGSCLEFWARLWYGQLLQ